MPRSALSIKDTRWKFLLTILHITNKFLGLENRVYIFISWGLEVEDDCINKVESFEK